MSLIDVSGWTANPTTRYPGSNPPNAPKATPKAAAGQYTEADVRALFAAYQLYDDHAIAGAVAGTPTETAQQRIARILGDLNAGRRTWDQVARSVAILPHNGGNGTYTPPGSAQPGNTTGQTPGTTGPGNPTDTQRDAYTRIASVFKEYGLEGLGDWAWQEILNGTSVEGMMIDLYDQPAFQQRFKVIFDRRNAGLNPVSPQDVLNYEDSWHQMAHAAGLPAGMSDRDTAQRLMAADLSPAELQARLQDGYVRMRNASPEVRSAMQSYFGVNGDAALAALMIDPDLALPDLERMVDTAAVGGTAAMHQWDVNFGLADRLARIGVNEQAAQAGFTHLDTERHLFEQTVSEQQPLTAETGIEAEFGLSGTAADQVKAVAQRRQADFSGSSSQASDQTGIIGAGQARSS